MRLLERLLSLQVWMPSNQVWPKLELPELLQFLNQAPPGAQQLGRPDFLKMPHLEQLLMVIAAEVLVAEAIVVGAAEGGYW